MKVSAVINKPVISLDVTKKSALISSIILASGIVSGTIIYIATKSDITNQLLDYFVSFSTDFSNKNKPEIFSGLVIQNLIYYILMLIFATNVFGTPAVMLLSFAKTAGLGVLAAYIYDSFALKGIEYGLLIFFPGKFFLIFAMLLLTQGCYLTSMEINKNIRNNSDRVVDFRIFSLRASLILLLFIVSSLVDFVTIISFSSLFDFS